MVKLGPRVQVRAVQPLHTFRVHVAFDNGTEREIDLEPYLHGPIFAPMREDPVAFSAVGVEGGTIAWPNGADIDPDLLYYQLAPAWMSVSKHEAA